MYLGKIIKKIVNLLHLFQFSHKHYNLANLVLNFLAIYQFNHRPFNCANIVLILLMNC